MYLDAHHESSWVHENPTPSTAKPRSAEDALPYYFFANTRMHPEDFESKATCVCGLGICIGLHSSEVPFICYPPWFQVQTMLSCYLRFVVSADTHPSRYHFATDLRPKQGTPTYDVLLQPPEPSTTAAAAASTISSGNTHREEDGQEAADADDAAAGRELTALSASDIAPLQPFELEDLEADSRLGEEVAQVAERLKDRGNTLFKLGDTDAAAEMFIRVLRTLEPKPVVGESMWRGVKNKFRGSCQRESSSLAAVPILVKATPSAVLFAVKPQAQYHVPPTTVARHL